VLARSLSGESTDADRQGTVAEVAAS